MDLTRSHGTRRRCSRETSRRTARPCINATDPPKSKMETIERYRKWVFRDTDDIAVMPAVRLRRQLFAFHPCRWLVDLTVGHNKAFRAFWQGSKKSKHSGGRRTTSPTCNITQCLSGLVVTYLAAVWEDPGSNLTAGSCVYHDSHCDIQPWARATHPYCST